MKAGCFLRHLFFILIIGLPVSLVAAQGFSFSEPVPIYPFIRSDKPVSITRYQEEDMAAWKDSGMLGSIHFVFQKDGGNVQTIAGAHSKEAPLLLQAGNKPYLFWVNENGLIEYAAWNNGKGFEKSKQTPLMQAEGKEYTVQGMAGTVAGDTIIVSAYERAGNRFVVWKLLVAVDGSLMNTATIAVPAGHMAKHVGLTVLPGNRLRFYWTKKETALYADYDCNTGQKSEPQPLLNTGCKWQPVIMHTVNGDKQFYFWNGDKKNNRLYYAIAGSTGTPVPLPGFQPAAQPVTVAAVGEGQYRLVYKGTDGKLYSSHFFEYDPASWMGTVLLPGRMEQTLQDIVIPGSHDAGMSVLTAAGGQQKGTINECNTLTQVLPISKQLQAGIRMFDLRVGVYNGLLYTKHASSDCMEYALGGGYGEPLKDVILGLKNFLQTNNREIVLLTFSHFCDQEITMPNLADSILAMLGRDLVFRKKENEQLHEVKLKDLAGKAVLNFEVYKDPENYINTGTIARRSDAFINFVREYASTNDLKRLLVKEKNFFQSLKDGVKRNDLVRLDWQLTQSADEAAMSCNAFQSENAGVLLNTTILLINKINKHKSILNLARMANSVLVAKMREWMDEGTVNAKNKPNILYVDDAGTWITDYCVWLNSRIPYFRTKSPN